MIILYIVATYLLIGSIFSIIYVARLIEIMDESAKGSSLAFRLMIIPGCIALWPLLLRNFQKAKKQRND